MAGLTTYIEGRALKVLVSAIGVYTILYTTLRFGLPWLFASINASHHIAEASRDFWYGAPLLITVLLYVIVGIVSWSMKHEVIDAPQAVRITVRPILRETRLLNDVEVF